MKKGKKTLTLKTLSKSNVWGIQENDVFRMWEAAEKDADLKDNARHYMDVIKSAFDVEEIKIDKPEVVKKYEERGFKTGSIRMEDNTKVKLAIKKHPIMRVTDLTSENIRHLSAAKIIEVLNRNFGGGWESLSQSVKDIIESGFEVSTTILPKDRLHKKGGMYDKKVEEGFEVLEIEKGTWVEAIFVKEKPETEKTYAKNEEEKLLTDASEELSEDEEEDEEDNSILIEEDYKDEDEDDDSFDEDKLTEESYRTTFETDNDELNMEAESLGDEEEDNF
ncbi:hypothetical protein J5A66_05135 [Prevotella sp. oral taxon 475]|uniref:hypothetical protein n=1 Tax=Prevotella sp. oral taxon 475 TaxID=712471 RepID=UPI001BABCF8E|nr:hypothetical protein [Prevotella sp. oral taxon 475]QUB46394.1 hypothetical protein J5A66_05135 [Prevotella sp. oral taxon 475]